jgi:hypothetical protein
VPLDKLMLLGQSEGTVIPIAPRYDVLIVCFESQSSTRNNFIQLVKGLLNRLIGKRLKKHTGIAFPSDTCGTQTNDIYSLAMQDIMSIEDAEGNEAGGLS